MRRSFSRYAVAALFVGIVGCGGNEQAAAPGQGGSQDAIEVTVADVKRQPIDDLVVVTGTLYGDEEATISTKIAGRISEIYVDVGDRVPAGGKLARIDPVDDELFVKQKESALAEALAAIGLTELPGENFDVSTVSTVERARLQFESATSRRKRGEQLFTQQPPLISEQDFDDLKTAEAVAQKNYDVAKLEAQTLLATARSKAADLNQSQQRLRDTVITAPAATGFTANPQTGATTNPLAGSQSGAERFAVAERIVSVGEYLSLGAATFRLVADDVVKFRTAVPERYGGQVNNGQRVMLSIEGDETTYEGTVTRIAPAVDQQSRTFQVEILVPNPHRRLRPGSFARGSIVVGQIENVAFVPQNAIATFAGVSKVYAVVDGKIVEVTVTLGTPMDDLVPLLAGFKTGARVATSNLARLSNGAAVKVGEKRE